MQTLIDNANARFKNSYGVELKFEPVSLIAGRIIDFRDLDEIERKFAVKLSSESPPDLIFTDTVPLNALIRQKAVADVRNRIPNLDKVYEGLLEDEVYYVPIAMMYLSHGIRRSVLEDLGFDLPELNRTRKDYLKIRNRWLEKNRIYFSMSEFEDIISDLLRIWKCLIP